MNRFSLGTALVAVLAGCGGDAESRELDDQASGAGAQPVREAAAPVRAIPEGTVLTFEVRETVSTSSHSNGAGFNLVLVNGVTGVGGAVLAGGTSARGLVTDSHKSTGPDDNALLGMRVVSIEIGGVQRMITGEVQSTALEVDNRDSGARSAATVATGAAAGAIIGQILGRDTRSTVTGAAVGTAVGVGVALTTRGGDATLPQGSRIVVRLADDLIL